MMAAQCHCRECQYISGGAPNMFVALPVSAFKYTANQPKQFSCSHRSAIPRRSRTRFGTVTRPSFATLGLSPPVMSLLGDNLPKSTAVPMVNRVLTSPYLWWFDVLRSSGVVLDRD